MSDRAPAPKVPPANQFWVDVGGTFTDCIGFGRDGRLIAHKVLSNGTYVGSIGAGSSQERIVDPVRRADPPGFFNGFALHVQHAAASTPRQHSVCVGDFDPSSATLHLASPLPFDPPVGARYTLSCDLDAPMLGIRWLLALPSSRGLGPLHIRLGTTRATNALLERKGAPTAFVTTSGFGDLLAIGDQTRPRLFDLNIRRPRPFYARVIELDERIDARGRILLPLDPIQVHERLTAARNDGIETLAVAFLNSYRNSIHEDLVAEVAAGLGFKAICLSSQLDRAQRILPRAQTTVVNAYLSPVVRDYLDRLHVQAPQARLDVMTSPGALVPAANCLPKDAILSGPAGGVVAVAEIARRAGLPRVIGLDMGGTSTDVCRFEGHFDRADHVAIHDRESGAAIRIATPALRVETVAAGGGSICGFDGVKPVVGPESAGASPGPACYGAGGPLCITDVNLILGRIVPDRFPFPLDSAAALRRLDELIARIEAAGGPRYARESLADGYARIADAAMAAAIHRISTRCGADPRDHALVCFGGAAGQHACALARELDIRRIIIPPFAGLLSAFGIGHADATRFAAEEIRRPLQELGRSDIDRLFDRLADGLRDTLLREGFDPRDIRPAECALLLRYEGQDNAIPVARPADDDWLAAFHDAHARLNGFILPRRAVHAVAARVQRTGVMPRPFQPVGAAAARRPDPHSTTRIYLDGARREAALFLRDKLSPGDSFDGPALVADAAGAVVVAAGWRCEVSPHGDLLLATSAPATDAPPEHGALRCDDASSADPGDASAADPVTLELFHHRFADVAERMGAALQRAALSVNVKERLDYSCAVYDPEGNLVAHAAHIPVHIGAMDHCVRCLVEDLGARDGPGALRPGDAYVTNDPYRGGSHLPDITVITPVFDDAGEKLLFFVANRAHHAEIGGIAPGSMPAASRSLADEGVLISAFRLASHGTDAATAAPLFDEAPIRALLAAGPHPSRSPDENVADLRAQLAANHCGALALRALSARHGTAAVHRYMRFMQRAAEARMRSLLRARPPGDYSFVDFLDDGSPIAVRITIRDGAATVDFTGTAPVLPGNLNATPAIVSSAVLYGLRCLIDADVSLNAGLLAPIRILLPPCLLNPAPAADPRRSPAVAGGNVETSQRIVDVLFGALGAAAASQGTMNNVAFGNAEFGYYETLGGGAGAGPNFDGAHAVHTHMTNTRLTDPEVLEDRFPVRLRRFCIRRDSGGAGRRRGGDGLVRAIEFLAPLDVSLVTQRRVHPPYGLAGGEPGLPGRNRLIRQGGEVALPSIVGFGAQPGDVLIIETPGGGGYGAPDITALI